MGKFKRAVGSASSESPSKAPPSPVVSQELIDELEEVDEEEALDTFEEDAVVESVSTSEPFCSICSAQYKSMAISL